MICKYCGAHYSGNKCDACGKVMPLMKRSTEIDILMAGVTPKKPSDPPRMNTYEQGRKEGYQKGLTEGYNNGYADGVAALPTKNRIPMKAMALLSIAVFIVAAVLSGFIFGKKGYNSGFEKGSFHGNEQGVETGIQIATSTYEPLLTEKYNAGLDQGRAEGYDEGYAAAKDEFIASAAASVSPTPGYNETTETPSTGFSNPLSFPYSVANNGAAKDPVVKKIQTRLKELEYKVNGKTIADDGLFGPNTEKAIKKFQKDNGLKETGEVDLITYQFLFPDEKLPIDDNSSLTITNSFFPFTTPSFPYLFTPPSVGQPTHTLTPTLVPTETPAPTQTPPPSVSPGEEVVDNINESGIPIDNMNDTQL